MARVSFKEKALSTTTRRTFTTTLFHNDTQWKVLPFDANLNGVVTSDADASTDANPILRVQKVVGGVASGNIERLFIKSLVVDAEDNKGGSHPTTGSVNAIAKAVWADTDAFPSDASAVAEIVSRIYNSTSGSGIITCKRDTVPDGTGVVQQDYYGRQRPLKLMNFNC